MKNLRALSSLKLAGLGFQALALVGFTTWLVWIIFGITRDWASLSPYWQVLGVAIIIDYFIILLAIPTYLRSMGRARLLNIAMWSATLLMSLGIVLPYGLGGSLDLLGFRCAGFFGVTESCIEHWRFFFILLPVALPVVVWAILLAVAVITIKGIITARKSNRV